MKAGFALGVAMTLLVVSCSGSESEPTTESNSAEDVVITIEGFSFGDAPVVVGAGETVTVANADSVPHTWTSDDGVFDSGSIDPGAEFTYTFTEAGEYDFFCQVHPTMTGSVTVES